MTIFSEKSQDSTRPPSVRRKQVLALRSSPSLSPTKILIRCLLFQKIITNFLFHPHVCLQLGRVITNQIKQLKKYLIKVENSAEGRPISVKKVLITVWIKISSPVFRMSEESFRKFLQSIQMRFKNLSRYINGNPSAGRTDTAFISRFCFA